MNTQDFDLVSDRADDNVARLLAALTELGATYRDGPRNLRPGKSYLDGEGNQLLQAGNLKFDVLGAIDSGAYDDLLPHSEVLDVGGYPIRVLTLEAALEEWAKMASR